MHFPTKPFLSLRWKYWGSLLLFSLCVRAAVMVSRVSSLEDDPDAYVALAEGWAHRTSSNVGSNSETAKLFGTYGRLNPGGTVKPTAYRPPVYPWILSWLVIDGKLNRIAVAFLHVVFGVTTCLLTAAIAIAVLAVVSREHSTSTLNWCSWTAGLMTAIDPILLNQSTLVMTETLATTAVTVTWMLLVRLIFILGREQSSSKSTSTLIATITGFAFGVGALIRPTSLVWLGLLLAVGAVVIFCQPGLRRSHNFKNTDRTQASSLPILPLRILCLIAAGTCVVLTAWGVRNYFAINKFVVMTTHGGYTMLLANNPVLYKKFHEPQGTKEWEEEKFHLWWDGRLRGEMLLEDFEYSIPKNEVEDDELASAVAIRTIRRHPVDFLRSAAERIGKLWAVYPARTNLAGVALAAVACWYIAIYGLALAGLWRAVALYRRSEGTPDHWWLLIALLPGLLLLVSLMLVHTVYWSNIRMRGPAMPVLYVLASTAIYISISGIPRRLIEIDKKGSN